MHQNDIRLFFFQYLANQRQDIDGDVEQGLAVFHYGQIIIWFHLETIQHLSKHLPVLPGDADDHIQRRPGAQFFHQWTHFNSFWTGTKHNEYFFHNTCNILINANAVVKC